MALTKVTYTDNVTAIGATNLNDIQDEIIANAALIGTNASNISLVELEVFDRVQKGDAITNAQIDALFE